MYYYVEWFILRGAGGFAPSWKLFVPLDGQGHNTLRK